MSNPTRIQYVIAGVLTCSAMLFPAIAFSKEISLYDQPKADAKVVGTVDIATGVVPIFTPKSGDWMKVGDPRNGNVGWVKSSDMEKPGTSTSFTFTQRVMNDGSGPHTYQIIQYGKPQNLTGEDVQNKLKKMQAQQQAIQQNIQKAVQDMMNDMNSFYNWNTLNEMSNFPVIMPVVIVPVEKTTTPEKKK